MPVTKLDDMCALIVFDMQKHIHIVPPTVHPLDEIITRNAQLVRAFHERGQTVVFVKVPNAYSAKLIVQGGFPGGRSEMGMPNVTHMPDDWTDIIPELEQHTDDLVIWKPRWDSFVGTTLDYDLRQRGVTQVFITGIATSIGVESTARTACDLGYNVVPIIDAMTDLHAESHNHAIEKIFPRIGERATTDEVLALLNPTRSREPAGALRG